MILIADSGSTKTDWTLLADGGEVLGALQTEGITPIHQTEEQIAMVLADCQPLFLNAGLDRFNLTSLYFYGSGIIPAKQPVMERLLRGHFPNVRVVGVENDLLGAARALCGHDEGIACILGTGANSCFYDGRQIVQNTPPLGYILGDEGSGAALGKLFLNALFKGELPSQMREDYLSSVGMTYAAVIDRVYRQSMPNRFLASTSLYISSHLSCEPLRQLVIGNFRDFFRKNVRPYGRPDLPVSAVGSIAWHYRDLLAEAAAVEGFRLGSIQKSPMEGLIRYHSCSCGIP